MQKIDMKSYKEGFKDACNEVKKMMKEQFNKRDKLDKIDINFLMDKVDELFYPEKIFKKN